MIIALVVGALLTTAASGVPGLFLSRRSRAGERIALVLLVLGCAAGLAGSFWVAVTGVTARAAVHWAIPGGAFALRIDPLAAVFLVQIFALAPLAALYGIGYWPQMEHPENGRKLRLFFGLLTASMGVLVSAENTIFFLLGWEGMALAAFLVVTTDDRDAAVRQSGFVYLVATRIGTLGLFGMFAVLRATTGSWSFAVAGPAGGAGTAIFVLGLIGCMLKAGAIPAHVWLPGAHANAPSHVSALMSGVLIKMGIYGLMRVVSLFAEPPPSWGIAIFVLGVVSGVLGVAFALGQHDLKRLLAYHSVENIGIILMGFGLAVCGRSLHEPSLVALGMAGALLHVWNHGLFKALLFLSAGAVIHGTHTREIDALGGLAKRMPKTAVAFLIGAVAICGLPPFNGFVSELFIYIGMFRATLAPSSELQLAGSFGIPALALIGALALACFVKAYSAVFLGEARSEHGAHARDPDGSMTSPTWVLAACCAFIGVLPFMVAPILSNATSSFAPEVKADLASLAPLSIVTVTSAILLGAILLLSLMFSRRAGAEGPTWDCGYARPTARMQYTSSSFADVLVGLFAWALRPTGTAPRIATLFPPVGRFHSEVPDTILDRAVIPSVVLSGRGLRWFRWIQSGRVQLYLVYIVVTLVLAVLLLRK